MDYYKQFQKKISGGEYPAFLALWEEYCASDEIDAEELKCILEAVKDSEMTEPFGRYVEHILPLWDLLADSPLKHKTLSLVYDLQNSNTSDLCDRLVAYLKERYPDDKLFSQKARLAGLRECLDFQGALANFDLLSHMEKGNFVFHTGGWGVGEIMDVSLLREQLRLEFDYVSGFKDFSFDNAFKTLIPIPKDHFLAMRFGRPDALEEWAKKDPVAVMHRLLTDLGPKTAAEIKDELADLVIPEKEWTRWWQTTRSKLKKDTLVEVPEDLRSSFKMRKAELSHEERLQKALEKKPDMPTLIQTVYSFMRDFPSALKNEECRRSLKETLEGLLTSEKVSNAEEIVIRFFLEDLSGGKASKTIAQLIKKMDDIETLLSNIDIIAFKKRALVAIRNNRDDWTEHFLSLFFTLDQNPLRDYVLTELLATGKTDEFMKAMEDHLKEPQKIPQAFLWYFQKLMRDTQLPFSTQEGKNRFFEAFLILFYQLEQDKSQRDLVKKMYTLLTTGRFAHVRKIFQGADKETVHEFLLLATKCHSITDHDKKILHSLAEVVHPSLAKLAKKYGESEEDQENAIWTTEEGFLKLKERIHHIATVETVENAKQIEIARSYGDLRENAEYKSAQEQRKSLQSELKRLSDQLAQMRILTPVDINTENVGVGTIIDCHDDKGEKVSYKILGPWDADPDNHILSFQSKLAKEMIGLAVGDSFTVSSKSYTIDAIRNYFD